MEVVTPPAAPPPENVAYIQSLLSLGQIATLLKRDISGVFRAIRRLKIQPVLILGGRRYDPSVVGFLANNMRRPNRARI